MPKVTTIEEIMTRGVSTVTLEDPISRADEIMRREHTGFVPVIDDGKFIGLITERSLREYALRQIYEFNDDFKDVGQNTINDFQHIMAKNVRLIYPEDSVRKAIELMAKYSTDCLPVVDWKNNLIGLVTTFDVMMFLYKTLEEM